MSVFLARVRYMFMDVFRVKRPEITPSTEERHLMESPVMLQYMGPYLISVSNIRTTTTFERIPALLSAAIVGTEKSWVYGVILKHDNENESSCTPLSGMRQMD